MLVHFLVSLSALCAAVPPVTSVRLSQRSAPVCLLRLPSTTPAISALSAAQAGLTVNPDSVSLSLLSVLLLPQAMISCLSFHLASEAFGLSVYTEPVSYIPAVSSSVLYVSLPDLLCPDPLIKLYRLSVLHLLLCSLWLLRLPPSFPYSR